MAKVKPKIGKPKDQKIKARLFYKSINWAAWWDEFLFSIKENGSPRYPTAWSFAKKKGRTEFEQQVIYRAIGPESQPAGTAFDLDVPHQGNWVERRAKGFWVDQEGSKAEILRNAIKEKADNLEILRQFTYVPQRFLTQYQRMAEQIVEHFGGQVVSSKLSEKDNFRRAKTLFFLLSRCQEGASSAIDDLAKCLGLHPGAPDKWADLAILSSETAAKAALKGQEQGMVQGGALATGQIATVTKLVSMIFNKAKTFDLPLPEQVDDTPIVDDVKTAAKNGKVH